MNISGIMHRNQHLKINCYLELGVGAQYFEPFFITPHLPQIHTHLEGEI